MASCQVETALHRHVADIGNPQRAHRSDAKNVLERSYALHGAHGARSKSCTRPVGDAQIHRYSDERDIEPGERVCLRLEWSTQQRRRVGKWPFALIAVPEDGGGHPRELGIENFPPASAAERLAQGLELLGFHAASLQGERRSSWLTIGARLRPSPAATHCTTIAAPVHTAALPHYAVDQ